MKYIMTLLFFLALSGFGWTVGRFTAPTTDYCACRCKCLGCGCWHGPPTPEVEE